ncbi:MAG TPA: PDZ domain-containing protein [Dermatophilaceae bacterium]|nr:PDZ domain-containing protein [Dermatophilaceae bacterium]
MAFEDRRTDHPLPPTDVPADVTADVIESAPAAESRRQRRGRRFWREWGYLVALGLAFALGILAGVVRLPYAIMTPGPPTDVLADHKVDGKDVPRIVVTGKPTYPTSGSLDFTTVQVRGGPGYPVNAVDVLRAWLDPNQDVYPVEDLFPPQATSEQIEQENKAEMVGSQQEAAAVALRALGYDVPQVVSIGAVAKDAPSGTALRQGDVLVSIGGAPATDSAAVRAAIQAVPVGQAAEVVVVRDGSQQTVQATTGRSADGRTVLGIILRRDYRLPVQVTVDAGNVGGPSAGTMFALGIYDKLTDGAMTGGQQIAGTGTIDDQGRVGPIGGIPQKMAGARQAGIHWFLAPADNCDEVVGREPDGLRVVKVATFADARAAVEAIGQGRGDALPQCTKAAG